MLKEVGYNTVGMSSMNPWTSSYFGYDRGFDVFKDYMDRIDRDSIFESERIGKIKQMIKHIYDFIDDAMDRNREQDMRFANDAAKELQGLKSKDPWFMWVHYMDAHTDYFPEHICYGNKRLNMKWYINILNKIAVMDKHFSLDIKNDIIDLYDSAVKQADKAISRLVANVDTKNTMVIITSDHGEAFEEHGKWVHQYSSMYNELINVPLIIHYPGQEDSVEFTEPTSSVDIMPTISDVTGAFLPSIVRGSSLLGDLEERPMFHGGLRDRWMEFEKQDDIPMARGVTFKGKRMMVGCNPDESRLFDLDTDPDERENLVNDGHYECMKNYLSGLIMGMRDNEKRTIILEGGK